MSFCIWVGGLPLEKCTVQARDAQPPSALPETLQRSRVQHLGFEQTPQELTELGAAQYGAGAYQSAISSWQQAFAKVAENDLTNRSILLENLARAYRQIGDVSEEISYWEQAIALHQQLGSLQPLGRARTEQAQAYSRLGQYRRAIAILCGDTIDTCASESALHIARALADASGEAAALASLGEAYRLSGQYDQALMLLEQSLLLSETHSRNAEQSAEQDTEQSAEHSAEHSADYRAAVLNSLGNTHSALAQVSDRRAQSATDRGDRLDAQRLAEKAEAEAQQAIAFLQRSINVASSSSDLSRQVRSQLNLIPLYRQTGQLEIAAEAWQSAYEHLAVLPDSQSKVFHLLTLAGQLEADRQPRQCPADTAQQQIQLLETAIQIAEDIHNPRAESFALGQLGNLYERCGDYEKALDRTQAARIAADQNRSARDSLYLWAWQQGRILRAQQQPDAAATAYAQALEILDSIRSDLLAANPDAQFDFRDRVEPIYREFASLKLINIPPSTAISIQTQPSVDTVLATLDSLKLAELQNYFANDCIITPTATRVDAIEAQSTTAVISTALLENQLAVIASFPDGQRQVEWANLTQQQLTEQVNAYRIALERGRIRGQTFEPTTQLYDWLVRPFEEPLNTLGIDTLVFIHDGILRSLPMAALHDGQQYLVEKYAIATTPTLTLTDPGRLDRSRLSALILGLSEASRIGSQVYEPLSKVEEEISSISTKIFDSKILKNENFSTENMKQALQENRYQILHIATHGNFGPEPEDNFIITGQKIGEDTNKALTISELDSLIRSVSTVDKSIDLLTLTACETSIGDDRATLGLAGVAVRAGVNSAIASLWAVDDSATASLITDFYDQLSDPALTKAQALQAAQKKLIESDDVTQHPYYWAAFTLIGNWL